MASLNEGLIVITKMLRRHTARMTGAIAVLALTAGVFSTPASADPPPTYVGLGDSYAAGIGGGEYGSAPAFGDVPPCIQTDAAYPAQLRGLNLACSGATTADVSRIVTAAANHSSTARRVKHASHITVTVGGNDIGAAAATVQCAGLTPAPECNAALFESLAVKLPQLPAKIKAMVAVIKSKAPRAKIVLTGYPRLFTVDSMAPEQKTTATTINAAVDLLNATLAASALANRVGYVSVTQRFTNHGVGSADPWIVGPPPVCLATLTCAPDGRPADTFHPNEAGHSNGYVAAVGAALTR
ncbi:SGNH/GDSL hydrolase family protein [Arthrobacter sp. D1-17]